MKKNNCIGVSVFAYTNKQKYPIYVPKNTLTRHINLSLIVEQGKNHYAFFKDFSTLMCNYTLHRGRKHFCYYCLQTFSTKEILKCHINDCFKINVNVDVK